jgi:uncharacterized sulfatase
MVDLYPTLLNLCGVKPPENQKLAGRSLRPLIQNPNGSGEECAFTMVTRAKGNKIVIGRSVRTAHWRFTDWDEGRDGIELYDETQDPEENHDLSKNPKYSDILVSLKKYFEKLPAINMDEAKLISPKD